MIEEGEKTTFHMPVFMRVLYTLLGLVVAGMVALSFSTYSKWRNQASVPDDKEAILQSLAVTQKPAEVYESQVEGGERLVWVRIELPKGEVPQAILSNEKLMAGLKDVESSGYRVDQDARSLILYDKDRDYTWVPDGFFLKSGYEGGRRSVAVYESEESSNALVIVHLTL